MSIASTSVIQIIPRSRRGVELLLLIVAIVVSVGAYVNIGITVQDKVPASTGYYAAGIGLLSLIAHFALRFRAPYADPVLLPCAVILNGLGVAMIHRIDLGLALGEEPFTSRLLDTGGRAKKDRITHRVALTSLADIDLQVKRWLKQAYARDA